ncbi:MAG: class I SAM-dependent methyltransferase [Candidatus Omnitrophota bacterium]
MMPFQKRYWERKSLKKRRSPHHPVVREYVLSKIEQIKQHVDIGEKTRVLDVGAGNGFFSFYLDKICETHAVDYSETMLKMNPVKNKYLMDAEGLDFADNSFDMVFCHALLHHVRDMDKVLSEMRRVSDKHVVVIEPNRNNVPVFLFSSIVAQERKALKFSLKFLERECRRNGLKPLAMFSHGLIVPNKTPVSMLNFLKKFDNRMGFGVTNVLIMKK